MYVAMAFLIEGMVIIGGLFFQETVTDFTWLIQLGWSPFLVGFLGIIFVGIGGYLSYEIWIFLGITPESPRILILLLNSPYILYFGLAYLISQMLLPSEISFMKHFLVISLVLHWSYLGLRIMLVPILMPRIQKRIEMDVPKATIGLST